MNFWEYLDRHTPTSKGWVGLAVTALTVMLLWVLKEDQEIRNDEFFQGLAMLIIGTGFVNGVVASVYTLVERIKEPSSSQPSLTVKPPASMQITEGGGIVVGESDVVTSAASAADPVELRPLPASGKESPPWER